MKTHSNGYQNMTKQSLLLPVQCLRVQQSLHRNVIPSHLPRGGGFSSATTAVTCWLLALGLWERLWRALHNHKPLALLQVTVSVPSKPLVAAPQGKGCAKQGQGISAQCLLLFAVGLL